MVRWRSSVAFRIPKILWDAKGNRAKGKSAEARDINLALDNIKAQIIKHYQRIPDREAYVTTEMVRNAYQGIGNEYETLLGAFDKDNATFQKRVGTDRVKGTYLARGRARNHMAAFIKSNYKRSDLSMLELTPDFIKEFAVFLSTDRGLQNGSIWTNCMWLKGVVMRAHFNGLIPRNPFAQFHISPNIKEREYLTEDELKTLMTHEFADSKLSYIRDIFVFASFTALSFVDIKELTTDDIVEVNGDKWIISKRHKTKIPFQVKLLDIPLQIIKRYEPFQTDKSIFPNLSYWSICKPLKKMIKECGITKAISFHCSRHGFATLALSKGMPIESVSRVLGHSHDPTLCENNHAENRPRPDHVREQAKSIIREHSNGIVYEKEHHQHRRVRQSSPTDRYTSNRHERMGTLRPVRSNRPDHQSRDKGSL